MGYIDRSWPPNGSTDIYHYARANGSSGVFWTTASYNTSGVGAPVASEVDIYHREVVHVLSGNYTLVYKRATKTAGTGITNNIWRWHSINPITQVGSVYYTDSGGGRRFRKLIQSSAAVTYLTKQSTDYGSTAYREELSMPMTIPAWSLEVLQITGTGTASMQTTSVIPQSGIGLPIDHTMRGVTINEAVYKHFLWSTMDDGSTPATIRYYVQRNGTDDVHRVFNLKPGYLYTVTEDNSGLPSGYYKYVLTENTISGFAANSGGIVQFTPATIGTGGINYIAVGVTDSSSPGVSTVSRTAIFGIGLADSGTGVDAIVPTGPTSNTVPVSVLDYTSAAVDSIHTGVTQSIRDSGGTTTDNIAAVVIGAPHPTYIEKRISGPSTSMLPNSDLSIQFCGCEPNDGVFYSKLADDSDDNFIRPITLPTIQFCDLQFGLTDSSGSVYTIRSIQFAVRVRKSELVSISNPRILMGLYRGQGGSLIVEQEIPFFNTQTGVWLRSVVVPVSIKNSDIKTLVMRMQFLADSYGNDFGSYNMTVSGAYVDVSGDAPEKVI